MSRTPEQIEEHALRMNLGATFHAMDPDDLDSIDGAHNTLPCVLLPDGRQVFVSYNKQDGALELSLYVDPDSPDDASNEPVPVRLFIGGREVYERS